LHLSSIEGRGPVAVALSDKKTRRPRRVRRRLTASDDCVLVEVGRVSTRPIGRDGGAPMDPPMMTANRCRIAGAVLVAGAALYLLAGRAGHLLDPALPVDPLGWLWSAFDEPGPPAIGEIGHLIAGELEIPERFEIWTATREDDLLGVDPAVHLYGQIVRLSAEGAEPLPHVFGRVQTFRDDGTPVSPGVLVRFRLVSRDGDCATYRSAKPLLLIDNRGLEGEHREVIAVYAEEDCCLLIVAP
jgi:hypothetical protein